MPACVPVARPLRRALRIIATGCGRHATGYERSLPYAVLCRLLFLDQDAATTPSKTIVAVNNDPEAPIFEITDFVEVADIVAETFLNSPDVTRGAALRVRVSKRVARQSLYPALPISGQARGDERPQGLHEDVTRVLEPTGLRATS
jgi:hypothetical protein